MKLVLSQRFREGHDSGCLSPVLTPETMPCVWMDS